MSEGDRLDRLEQRAGVGGDDSGDGGQSRFPAVPLLTSEQWIGQRGEPRQTGYY